MKSIIDFSKKLIGIPYKYKGDSPEKGGFDSSGFVQYIYYKSLNIKISRKTKDQINEGIEIERQQLIYGDLVFTSEDHVGIYIGNNKIIHSIKNKKVEITKIDNFYTARRIIGNLNNLTFNNSNNFYYNLTKGDFIFHYKTILHKTGDNFQFLIGDYNNDSILDLYCIKQNKSGTNSTEVHILDGSNNFKSFLLQTGTALHETGDNFQFLLGDYNNNGILDLYCIKKYNTETNSTEVHILNGSNNFHSCLLETGTALYETGDCFEFLLGDYNNNGILDLYCIKKFGTNSGKVEIYILDGSNNFQSCILQTSIEFDEIDDECQFGISYYNGNKIPDVYCIKKKNTESNFTEVYILNGSNNYQSFISHIETKLEETDKNFVYYPYKNKLFAIQKQGDNCTEVHCLKL